VPLSEGSGRANLLPQLVGSGVAGAMKHGKEDRQELLAGSKTERVTSVRNDLGSAETQRMLGLRNRREVVVAVRCAMRSGGEVRLQNVPFFVFANGQRLLRSERYEGLSAAGIVVGLNFDSIHLAKASIAAWSICPQPC
jgi:hypothetical protein